MRLRFDQRVLEQATSIAQSVANPQSSLPILGNIRITATPEGNVIFDASDMESCVRYTIRAEVEEAGAITVPAKHFHNIVRELPSALVELDFSKALAGISCEGNQYQLTTQTPEDFPNWPDLTAATTLSIEQGTLKRILSHVLYALPQKDPRKVLLGAFFDLKDNHLVVVATDGKKLGLSRCDVPEVEGVQPASAIIPHKILSEVMGHLSDEGMVQLLIGERQVAFDLGNLIYLSNRIDGIFPNYDMVIPGEFTKEIRLPRGPLVEAIRRAAIISEEQNNSIIMRFEPGRIRFSSRTYEVGSFQGLLQIAYDGEPFDIAFNHLYLSESLRVMDGDTVVMKVKQNTAPVVFVMPDREDSLFLVMPIKLTDIADFGEGE